MALKSVPPIFLKSFIFLIEHKQNYSSPIQFLSFDYLLSCFLMFSFSSRVIIVFSFLLVVSDRDNKMKIKNSKLKINGEEEGKIFAN